MSISQNTPTTIAPENLDRVKAVAVAILDHGDFEASDLLDQVLAGPCSGRQYQARRAMDLAARIVNFLLEPEFDQAKANLELLRALQREAGQ